MMIALRPLRHSATLTLVLLLGTNDAWPGAQQPTPGAQTSPPEASRTERGRKHILHLADGRVLRVRARRSETGWMLRQGRDWITIPATAVKRAALERDVLAQAKRLERDLARDDDPVRRVAYGDWCLREGLAEEALRTLDGVLAAHPDQPDALALLRSRDLPLALPPLGAAPGPAELSAFFAVASKVGPAAQEIAIGRLGGVKESPGLLEWVTQELTDHSPRSRKLAARALRRLFPGRQVRPLLRRSILDSSREVRTEASFALRDVGDPAMILPAVRALGSERATVRDNAVQALAHMAYPAAVEPLYHHLMAIQGGGSRAPHANIFVGRQFAYVQDFDVEVATGAAVADPVINIGQEGVVLDAAVLSASTSRFQAELGNIRRGLSMLTGANPGNTTADWMGWWNEHGEEWKADRVPPGPSSSPRSPGD